MVIHRAEINFLGGDVFRRLVALLQLMTETI